MPHTSKTLTPKVGTDDSAFGRVTIPSESGFAAQTEQIGKRWGADAVRNSDGTELDEGSLNLGLKVYEAYFPARGHNEHVLAAMEERTQMYLMSERVAGPEVTIQIDPMENYFDQEIEVNRDADPHTYWEVIDRTTGQIVPVDDWDISPENIVTIRNAAPWHEYTVSFLAYVNWDPVEMYNHLTNDWGDKERAIPFDIRHPRTHKFVIDTFESWCKENPHVNVVRFTTFFYQFALVFDRQARERFVDWFGYGASISPLALDDFEKQYGYRLRPEDFVDEGYYNASFRIPSARYLDYLSFVGDFVTSAAKEMVDIAHAHGKEAMMFLGDQWIGMEPYGPNFPQIGMDAVVGSVGDGTTLRMIADIPGIKYTEGRFLPYFFPDTFFEGNDAAIEAEALDNWRKARRALLRKPLDRMGYGGYLSLAAKHPGFIEIVGKLTAEFREIHAQIKGTSPETTLRVAVLNAWGKIRTWQAFTVAHALYSKEAYSYYGVLESLSGLPVDVEFISFDDVHNSGIDESIDVIITGGDFATAFSGGDNWKDAKLVSNLRAWVHAGGALIGIGQPTATDFQGRFFQLADCLGVDQERGFSQSHTKYHPSTETSHFITADLTGRIDCGEGTRSVYATDPDTEVLSFENSEVQLSVHEAGAGRAVYLAGLPYSMENSRLLLRALYYATRRESETKRWFSSNPACDVNYYPEAGTFCVANATNAPQVTTVFDGSSVPSEYSLAPDEIIWGQAN